MKPEIKRIYWFFYGKKYWHRTSIKTILKRIGIKRKPKRVRREELSKQQNETFYK